jgi:hypothetical protein
MLFCTLNLDLLPEVYEHMWPNVFEARIFLELSNKLSPMNIALSTRPSFAIARFHLLI